MARGAARVLQVPLHALAQRRRPAVVGLVGQVARARAAAAARDAPSTCSRSHLPRRTGDVRVGYDVTVSTLACVKMPAALLAVERHAPEALARDARDAVVLREPLVQEREAPVHEVEDAAVLRHHGLEEHLRLAQHVLAQPRR